MIEQLKESLAKEKIEEFLESMQQLGFQNNETITLITKTLEGEKQ